MKRKMYGLVISMAAALIMTGCGQTPAVQEKSGAESADAQTSSPQNPQGTTQESLSSGTDTVSYTHLSPRTVPVTSTVLSSFSSLISNPDFLPSYTHCTSPSAFLKTMNEISPI